MEGNRVEGGDGHAAESFLDGALRICGCDDGDGVGNTAHEQADLVGQRKRGAG